MSQDAASLHSFFGAHRAGPPPSVASRVRLPNPVYLDGDALSSLPSSFWAPVSCEWLPSLSRALRGLSLPPLPEKMIAPSVVEPSSPVQQLPVLPPPPAPVYGSHLLLIVRQAVIECRYSAHLFSPREVALANRFLALSPAAINFISRIFNRRSGWLTLKSCAAYSPEMSVWVIVNEILSEQPAAESEGTALQTTRALQPLAVVFPPISESADLQPHTALDALLSCGSVEQLRAITSSLHVVVKRAQSESSASSSKALPTRADLVAALRHALATQRTISGSSIPFAAHAARIVGKEGTFFCLSKCLWRVLSRAHSLFYLSSSTSRLCSGLGTGHFFVDDQEGADDEEEQGFGDEDGIVDNEAIEIEDSDDEVVEIFEPPVGAPSSGSDLHETQPESSREAPHSPLLLSTFGRIAFVPVPSLAMRSKQIFETRRDLLLFEAAHVFRSQMDSLGTLGDAPMCALPAIGGPVISDDRSQIRRLTFPWENEATACSTSPWRQSWPPVLAGIGLLPFAPQLLGIAPRTKATARPDFVSACKAAVQEALSRELPVASSYSVIGIRTLLSVLRMTSASAFRCLSGTRDLSPPSAGDASALFRALRAAPCLAAAARASLCLALTDASARQCPEHLLCFTPASMFAAILWEILDSMERSRAYAHAAAYLVQLVGCGAPLHRCGRMWERLAIDLEHCGLDADAHAVINVALQDPRVSFHARLTLRARSERLSKRQGAALKESGSVECIEVFEDGTAVASEFLLLDDIRSAANGAPSPMSGDVPIDVFRHTALNRRVGEKSRYVAAFDADNDGADSVGASTTDTICARFGVTWTHGGTRMSIANGSAREDSLRTSVEGAALAYYATSEAGEWRGFHCEGSPIMSLWSLLLCDDVLFGPEQPLDVFVTPFQDAPLDINVPGALHGPNRVASLRRTLLRIATSDSESLCMLVSSAWRKHHGRAMRGVTWTRFPLALLQLIAVALGGPTIAALFDVIAKDHRALSSGLPDLILLRVNPGVAAASSAHQPEEIFSGTDAETDAPELSLPQNMTASIRFVEVKGPSDVLSDKQVAWLRFLRFAGADARLCECEASEGSKGRSKKSLPRTMAH